MPVQFTAISIAHKLPPVKNWGQRRPRTIIETAGQIRQGVN